MYAFFRVHKSFQSSFKYAMLAKCPSIERHCRFTHRTFLTLEKCQNKHGLYTDTRYVSDVINNMLIP